MVQIQSPRPIPNQALARMSLRARILRQGSKSAQGLLAFFLLVRVLVPTKTAHLGTAHAGSRREILIHPSLRKQLPTTIFCLWADADVQTHRMNRSRLFALVLT